MAKWQRHIYLQPEWGQAQENEISPQELAAVIAKRLKSITSFKDDYIEQGRMDLIDEFEMASEDEEFTVSDFDYLMHELYDWGDIKVSGKFFDAKKVCWIDTMTDRDIADA